MEPQLMTKKEAGEFVGLHAESVMRLSRQGRFPKPIRLGASHSSSIRFVRREVEQWLTKQMQERDAEPDPQPQ
ncbi:MAG TPA: AlpA family phage regulatory protein [Stellaceae bacterium]|nr:AlpA family phage regulatory protein [Stellaceae bacterium]